MRGGSCLRDIYIYIYKTCLIYRTCMRRAPAKPVRAFCESGVLFHMSHFRSPLRTSRCTLHTTHFTLHTSHLTLHISHFTVHTSHFKNTTKNSCCCVQEHDPRATPVQCQLSSKHFPHTSHCILHTSHSTPQFTLALHFN